MVSFIRNTYTLTSYRLITALGTLQEVKTNTMTIRILAILWSLFCLELVLVMLLVETVMNL